MGDLVSVRFIRGYSPYQTGEVAGFTQTTARELVRVKKVASYVNPPRRALDSAPADRMVTESEQKAPTGGTGWKRKGIKRRKKKGA